MWTAFAKNATVRSSSAVRLLNRMPPSRPISITVDNNPYQCKRTWPPDFQKLSQKHQFRLERRYRRRAKLKWARPTWTKAVKLAQWASIIGVSIYGVLFMEVGEKGDEATPFDRIRVWYREQVGSLETQRDQSAGTSARAPERVLGHDKSASSIS